jgi:hypothetical protein
MTSVSTSHGTSATNLKSAAAPSQAPKPHTPSRSGPAPTAPAPNATPAPKPPQLLADKLEAIQAQILAALTNAESVASTGTQGASGRQHARREDRELGAGADQRCPVVVRDRGADVGCRRVRAAVEPLNALWRARTRSAGAPRRDHAALSAFPQELIADRPRPFVDRLSLRPRRGVTAPDTPTNRLTRRETGAQNQGPHEGRPVAERCTS